MRISQEEVRIAQYISQHLGTLDRAQLEPNADEHRHGHDLEGLSPEDKAAMYTDHERMFWRVQYFKEHPDVSLLYKGGGGGGLCTNGDFEQGYTGWGGESGAWGSGECSGESNYMDIEFAGVDITTSPNHFLLTNVGTDIITGVPQVHTGNHAMRINWVRTDSTCLPNRGIDRLSQQVELTATNQDIAFFFAAVMQKPTFHNNTQPYFYVRALGPGNVVLDDYCAVADLDSDFLLDLTSGTWNFGPGCNKTASTGTPIMYTEWTCNILNVGGNIGDVVTLEFFMADCAESAHFGYAYVDDVCGVCTDPITGLVQLDPLQSCALNTTQVCGSYIPANNNGVPATVNGITLQIMQNGVDVTTTPPVLIAHDPVAHTFCFEVGTANVPVASGGYDVQVSIDFSTNNTEQDINTFPGPDNDIFFDGDICCQAVAPDNLGCILYSGGIGGTAELTWDAVPSATGYQVQVTTLSAACCAGATGAGQTFTFNTTTPFYFLSDAGIYDCARWRVRATCNGNTWSPWSGYQCLCSACIPETPVQLTCSNSNGTVQLNWAGTNAPAYQVEVTTFSCPGCTPVGNATTFTYNTAAKPYTLPLPASYYPCARWRVRERCTDGTWSAWSVAACICGSTSDCTSMLVNGNFEATTGTAPLTNCATTLPNWRPYSIGYTATGSTVRVPYRYSTSTDQFQKFPSTKNPESWDASPLNTRYAALDCNNTGVLTANTTARSGVVQNLPTPLVSGEQYYLRVRYAAYTHNGTTGSTFNLRAVLSNTTSCPPTEPLPNMVVVNQLVVVNASIGGLGTLAWNTVTVPVTATASLAKLAVEVRHTNLKSNTRVMVFIDGVELVHNDCPYDLNGNGFVDTGDLNLIVGYSGSSTNSILNMCHVGIDGNNDGVVNATDMALFNNAFGTFCDGAGMATQPGTVPTAGKMMQEEAHAVLVAVPNPTNGQFVVEHGEQPDGTLQVVSSSGAILESRRVQGIRSLVDLSAQPPGLYLVRVGAADNWRTVRVVKE